MAPVTLHYREQPEPGSEAHHAAGSDRPPSENQSNRWLAMSAQVLFSFRWIAASVLILAVGSASVHYVQVRSIAASPSMPAARRSVAVLGFKNLSGRSEEGWVSTALSDWLTTQLSAGGRLRLVPSEDVARMK